ncbi:MAG: hypothetical protein ACKOB4_16050, partial [Acidobacteriota bacterium]
MKRSLQLVVFGAIVVASLAVERFMGVSANETLNRPSKVGGGAKAGINSTPLLETRANPRLSLSDPAFAVPLIASAWTANAALDWQLAVGEPLISAAPSNLVPPPPLPAQMPIQQTSFESTTNQLIIKYRRDSVAFTRAQSLEQLSRLGVSVGMRLNYKREMSGDSHVLSLPAEMKIAEVERLAEVFKNLPEVEIAEPDRRRFHTLNTNDPYLTNGSLWGLNGTYGVNAPSAWDITTGSSGVVVAVIDTGITSHSDLNANVLPGYDFI